MQIVDEITISPLIKRKTPADSRSFSLFRPVPFPDRLRGIRGRRTVFRGVSGRRRESEGVKFRYPFLKYAVIPKTAGFQHFGGTVKMSGDVSSVMRV